MTRFLAIFSALVSLAACGAQEVDQDRIADLGEFRLGHNIVIAPNVQKVPGSRDATKEEWITALTQAFADRFERYEGDQLYHFGISVEGYMLAPPGVPVVASPKSAVILNVTIWEDSGARKLNEEPHQLLILETIDGGSIIGSGYTSDAEEQLTNLAFNASRELEKWLADQQEEFGWFDAIDLPEGETGPFPLTAAPGADPEAGVQGEAPATGPVPGSVAPPVRPATLGNPQPGLLLAVPVEETDDG